MEAGHSTWRCAHMPVYVCRCACVQDLIESWSEGDPPQLSPRWGWSRNPTVLIIIWIFHCFSPSPPPVHIRVPVGDGARHLFIRLNLVWSSANSAHICPTDFKERYSTLCFSKRQKNRFWILFSMLLTLWTSDVGMASFEETAVGTFLYFEETFFLKILQISALLAVDFKFYSKNKSNEV